MCPLLFCGSLYPNTLLFNKNNPQKFFFPWQGSGLSSLGRILWITTQTQLFLITQKKKSLAGEWPKLFRENDYEKTRFVG